MEITQGAGMSDTLDALCSEWGRVMPSNHQHIPEHIVLKKATHNNIRPIEIYWVEFCWSRKSGPVDMAAAWRLMSPNNVHQINEWIANGEAL